MKKFLLVLIALTAMSVVNLYGQDFRPNEDVIYGKDGIAISGTIIEEIPDLSYKIRTSSGEVYLFYVQDVDRITRGRVTSANDVTYGMPSRKSPGLALLGSVIMPGLGQFINDDFSLGLSLLGGCALGATITIIGAVVPSETGPVIFLGGLALWAGSYIYSIIEAPLAAMRYNRANGFALGNGSYLRLSPDLTLNNTVRGVDTACGMRMTLTF